MLEDETPSSFKGASSSTYYISINLTRQIIILSAPDSSFKGASLQILTYFYTWYNLPYKSTLLYQSQTKYRKIRIVDLRTHPSREPRFTTTRIPISPI